jgi:hypothetical protein
MLRDGAPCLKERNAIAGGIAKRYLSGMDLLTYIADMPRRLELAAALGTDPAYLNQLARKWRGKVPSHNLAQAIERETERLGPEKVPKESLRPDIWPPDAPAEPERARA